MTEYEDQAKKLWGDTPAYREYEEKTKGYTSEDHKAIANEMMTVFGEFGAIKDQSAASDKAQALVRKLQGFITAHYYTCTDEILASLGEAYGSGGEFTKNINAAAGDGTAEFASEAIKAYCIELKNESTNNDDLVLEAEDIFKAEEITFDGEEELKNRIAEAMSAYDKAMDQAAGIK